MAAYASYWPPDATDAQYFSYVTNAAGGLDITAYDTAGGLDVDSLIDLVKREMIVRCKARQSVDLYAREA